MVAFLFDSCSPRACRERRLAKHTRAVEEPVGRRNDKLFNMLAGIAGPATGDGLNNDAVRLGYLIIF